MGSAVTIKTSNPTLCRLKEFVYSLKIVHIVHKWRLLILFPPITTRLFSISAPFPAISILTIFLDKCQMKSFEDIKILIKVKLFCLKNLVFGKSFYLKKKVFENKNNVFETKNCLFFEKTYLKQKNFFLKKKSFVWKELFLEEKNFGKNWLRCIFSRFLSLVIFFILALLALLKSPEIWRSSCLKHAIGNYFELK